MKDELTFGGPDSAVAADAIGRALVRMLARPASLLPFVVIDVEGSDAFVQFVGSQSEALKIDCPPLRIVGRPIGLDEAPGEALRMLGEQGVQSGSGLCIVEGTQSHPLAEGQAD